MSLNANRKIVQRSIQFIVLTVPLAMLLFTLSWGWVWQAAYESNGHFFEEKYLRGFPFPAAGLFEKLNQPCVRCITINWTNYYLNAGCALLVATAVSHFFLNKLLVSRKNKIIFALMAITICLYCFFYLYIMYTIIWDYQGGIWPEKIDLNSFKYSFRLSP